MHPTHYALIAPFLNEGDAAVGFLNEMIGKLADHPAKWTIILVDDGSTDDTADKLLRTTALPGNIAFILLSLPYNMGHQRAIQQGLLFASTTSADRFIVMDADGEDDPAAISEMLVQGDASIVLVARGSRSGPLWFKLGYSMYKQLFKLMTGRTFGFGNFSMIDRRVLGAVLERPFVHYAAFLSKQKAITKVITSDRRKRIDGSSKMNLRSLTDHAFRSLIEYSEEVLAFFMKAFVLLTFVLIGSIACIVGIKLFTPYAIPGWASTLSLSLFNSVLICLGFFAMGLLLVNNAHARNINRDPLYKVLRPTT